MLGASFIITTRYTKWLSSIILVIKKNGQVQVCTNFRDLNLATPKDEYVVPIADMLVDASPKHGVFPFMDGHSGYNEFSMAVEDRHKTTFRCSRALEIYE